MGRNPRNKTTASSQRFWESTSALLIGLAVFVAPLIGGKLDTFGSSALYTLFLVAGVLCLLGKTSGKIQLPNRLILASLAVLILAGIASFANKTSAGATLTGLLGLIAFVTGLLTVASFPESETYKILGALTTSATVVALIGIREYILSATSDWRIFSTFFNPDFLAGFLALVLPVATAWYLSGNALAATVSSGVAVTAIFGALLLTGSRFGVISAAAGLIAFGLCAHMTHALKRIRKIRMALITVSLAIVLALLSGPMIGRVASVQAESHSGGFRIATWKGVIHMISSHPLFGTGLGTFEIAYPRYAEVGFTKLAHNSYLQLAAEAGVLTPIALALGIFAGLWAMVQAVRCNDANKNSTLEARYRWLPDRKLILAGIIAGILASCMRNVVDSDWYVACIAASFAVVVGAGLSHAPTKSEISISKRLRFVLLALYAIVTISSLTLTIAAWYGGLGGTAASIGDFDKALRKYEVARKLDPLNAEYYRALSQLYLMRAVMYTHSREDLNTAENFLSKTINLEPTNAKNYYQLARLYELTSRHELALEVYNQALKWDPHALPALLAKAELCKQMGRKGEALAAYRRMIEIEHSPYEQVRALPEFVEPSYALAHYELGLEYERSGNDKLAKREFQMSLKRIKAYRKSLENVGQILEASSKRDRQLETKLDNIEREIMKRLDSERDLRSPEKGKAVQR